MPKRVIEIMVGLFMIAGAVALVILALKVSGLTQFRSDNYYQLTAEFDNIGDLKKRAPVRLAGVRVGEVSNITLDKNNFRAKVTLLIDKANNNLPVDTSASIFTEGLLGSNYISLTPGYESAVLKNNGVIETTHPALILENLVGQLLFSIKGNNKKE